MNAPGGAPALDTGGRQWAASSSGELLAACQGGDRAAFAQLYRRYQPTIQRFLRCRVPDWAEAEDLTSETFLRALRWIDTAPDQEVHNVAAWLVTIARNLVISRARSARVRLAHQFGEIPPDACVAPGPGPDELALAASERLAASTRLGELIELAELSPVQRRYLQLRFVEELPVAQIAARLGRTENAARSVQDRALVKLRMRV